MRSISTNNKSFDLDISHIVMKCDDDKIPLVGIGDILKTMHAVTKYPTLIFYLNIYSSQVPCLYKSTIKKKPPFKHL